MTTIALWVLIDVLGWALVVLTLYTVCYWIAASLLLGPRRPK